jgi:predicted enzyme related to lactoylglutathione lyase
MHIQSAALPARDQTRATRFYVDILAWTIAADAPMRSDGWRWIGLKFAQSGSTVHFVRANVEDASDGPMLVLVDDDVTGTAERLRSRGVEILAEPHSPAWEPGRTVAKFRDSDGNRMVIGNR